MISEDIIRQKLADALPDAKVTIEDLTGGGDHYRLEVISDAFEGKLPVQRHRQVYAALRDHMDDGSLHALALSTRTPKEVTS